MTVIDNYKASSIYFKAICIILAQTSMQIVSSALNTNTFYAFMVLASIYATVLSVTWENKHKILVFHKKGFGLVAKFSWFDHRCASKSEPFQILCFSHFPNQVSKHFSHLISTQPKHFLHKFALRSKPPLSIHECRIMYFKAATAIPQLLIFRQNSGILFCLLSCSHNFSTDFHLSTLLLCNI